MKRFSLFSILFLLAATVFGGGDLKVLTIGNSFADSVFRDLPAIAESMPGCTLKLERANIGGCTLQRHWEEIAKAEADPSYKPYYKKFTLREKLESDKWDIVTLQQASPLSFKPETFEPYLGNLIEYVKKYAPQAEIVLQMTWAYRDDHPLFDKTLKNPEEMYQGILAAYDQYGKKYDLRVIPSGAAIMLASQTQQPSFKPEKRVTADMLQYPELPKEVNSLHNSYHWWKNKEGEHKLGFDLYHLNNRGSYLQSCVWFAILFQEDPRKITYAPDKITPEDAAFLRDTAAKTVETYRQPRDANKMI